MGSVVSAISDFSTWLLETFKWVVSYPLGFLKAMFELLFSKLHLLFEKILTPLWDFVQSVVNQVSMSAVISQFNNLPGGIGYFLDLFQAPLMLTSILSAYGIRFLIRRLPVIG